MGLTVIPVSPHHAVQTLASYDSAFQHQPRIFPPPLGGYVIKLVCRPGIPHVFPSSNSLTCFRQLRAVAIIDIAILAARYISASRLSTFKHIDIACNTVVVAVNQVARFYPP